MANGYSFTWSKAFKHWRVVRKHRKYVRQYCFKAKLYRQGLMHDLSKYSPVEFIESVKYFTGTHSPIDECKKVNGYSAAWMHHKSHNKHHHEYWTDNYDKGTTCIKMPWKYALECFCDYLGAGRAYGNGVEDIDGEVKWWRSKRLVAKMHEDTIYLLDCLFVLYQHHGASFLREKWMLKILERAYSTKCSYATYQQMLGYKTSRLMCCDTFETDIYWDKIGRPKDERYYFGSSTIKF